MSNSGKDQFVFSLDAEDWDAFVEVLDAPVDPEESARVARLMNEPPQWRQAYRTGELPKELVDAIRDAEAPEESKAYDDEYNDEHRLSD